MAVILGNIDVASNNDYTMNVKSNSFMIISRLSISSTIIFELHSHKNKENFRLILQFFVHGDGTLNLYLSHQDFSKIRVPKYHFGVESKLFVHILDAIEAIGQCELCNSIEQ